MTMPLSVHTSVHDVLDFFAKCPRCGYPAEATETLRRYADGEVEIEVVPSCGMPCGWHGPRRITKRS